MSWSEDDYWHAEMEKALWADGEKLRQLSGEDHGPWTLPEVDETTLTALRHVYALISLYEDDHPGMVFDGHLNHDAVKSARAFYFGFWDRRTAASQDAADEEADR